MFVKSLLVLCVVSVVVCKDLDSVLETISGSTETTVSTEATVPTYKGCVLSTGVNGECVPYYMCQMKEASDLLDIHFPVEEPCEFYLDVCCVPGDRIELTTASTPPSQR